MILWKPGQYSLLARFFHLNLKKVYNLLQGHSRVVCQTLKQLSWVFDRLWSLLQASSQLCFPKCGFVVLVWFFFSFFFLNTMVQLVPELIICNCYSRDTAECSRSFFRVVFFLRVSVSALLHKRTVLKPMMHLAQVLQGFFFVFPHPPQPLQWN